jgi:hypothetical protein
MKTTTGTKDGARTGRIPHQGKTYLHHAIRVLPVLLATALSALGGDNTASSGETEKPELGDLTLSNLFSGGWDEAWTRRSRADDTPDMALLRVQTNFLTDVFRLDYAYQRNHKADAVRGTDAFTGTLEYAFNRRFELGLVGYYNWVDSRTGTDLAGATAGAFARLQLVDTAVSSLATTLRVALPNHDIGGKTTTTSLTFTGWRNLSPLGLNRVGLYYHVQEETVAGPTEPGGVRNDLNYAISIAKTWTGADSLFGNASTFVEAYGKTNLDGNDHGHTTVTITPGVRATFAHRHIVMAGVDFPVANPRPYERIIRLTYIWNF